MRSWIRGLVAAFTFLTRLPVSAGPLTDRDLGRSVAFFPVVGLVLGLVVTGLGYLAAGLAPAPLLAVVVVAMLAVLTGALHLDGLGDTFDGIGGAHGDPERALAIMRDSRIGSYGVVALALVLAAKLAGVAAALEARDYVSLLAFPAVARFAVVPLVVLFPYARPQGLGRGFSSESSWRELVVAVVVLGLLVVALGRAVAAEAGVAIAGAMALGLWTRARLGGLTGDVYGAVVEIAEAAALFVAALLRDGGVR